MSEKDPSEQLAEIARDYYISKLPITEITHKYDISRYLVAKALEEAEKSGIVQISIKESVKRFSRYEATLKKKFNLKEVFVLRSLDTTTHDNEALVAFAATTIQNYIKSCHTVGMTWGSTILDTINNFQEARRDDLAFVQLAGFSLRHNSPDAPFSLILRASDKFRATKNAVVVPAPRYIFNPGTKKMLNQEPIFERLQHKYQDLDLIFTGLGTVQSLESNHVWAEYKDIIFDGIDQSKIAGMAYGRAYDIHGKIFPSVEAKVVGINHEHLFNTPIRFAIVKNKFKVDSLLGALRAGLITHLVINEVIAKRLIRRYQDR